MTDNQTTIEVPERFVGLGYTDAVVELVRTLDHADVMVRALYWHFGELREDAPEFFEGVGSVGRWSKGNFENFVATVPGLRSAFVSILKVQSPGIEVTTDRIGDATTAGIAEFISHWMATRTIGPGDQPPEATVVLPDKVSVAAEGRRVILFDGEAIFVPEGVSDSFVEVWFRRGFGGWRDGGPYPLYLVKRGYGWQGYGVER